MIRDTRLDVLWMFWFSGWFTTTGWHWANGQHAVTIVMAFTGVVMSFVYIHDRYETRKKLIELRQRLNHLIPVREYELRRERGIRVLVGRLRGGER